MSIEARVRTATCKTEGAYVSVSQGEAYGASIEEQALAVDMAKGIAQGHAIGHSQGLALESIARYKTLGHEERRRLTDC